MEWRAPGLGWLLVGVCLAGANAAAQTPGATPAKAETTTGSADAPEVSMEFLEFLGTWESTDGEWVDPTDVQAVDWPESRDASSETENSDAN